MMIPCGDPKIVVDGDMCFCHTPMYVADNARCTEVRLVMTKEAFITCYNEWIKDTADFVYNQYDANPNIGNWHCTNCRHLIQGTYNDKPDYKFCPYCGKVIRGTHDD